MCLSLSLSLWSHEIVADGLNNSQLLCVARDVDVLALACRETLPWSAHTESYVGLSVTYRTRYYPLRRNVRASWTCSAQSREDIYIYIYGYGFETLATLGRYDAAQGIAVQLLQNYAAVVAPEEDRVYKQHTKSLRFCCKRKSRGRAAKSS